MLTRRCVSVVARRRSSSLSTTVPRPPPPVPPARAHVPVMMAEVCSLLRLRPGATVLDMTFGAGGHTEQLLSSALDVTVYALDRDPSAYERALKMAAGGGGGCDGGGNGGRVVPLLGRFSELPQLLQQAGVAEASLDAVLIDCGCCSTQLEDAARGFSLVRDGPLDMRMDGDRCPDQVTAEHVLAHASEHSLARILRAYGEEPQARRIARAVVEARYLLRPLRTTGELAQLVRAACASLRRDSLGRPAHSATRTFQALRIFVNDELNELAFGVRAAHAALRPDGRLAVITFHSLEDRVVKQQLMASQLTEASQLSAAAGRHGAALAAAALPAEHLRRAAAKRWCPVNKHVLLPSPQEVADNPRSRSAKLRVAEKCAVAEEEEEEDGEMQQ